jgi:hypothetical protein
VTARKDTPQRQDFGADWVRRDPTRVEQERALWAMTPTERVTAMRASRLTWHQLTRWASRYPHEVPRLSGEFEFIAITTPEVADD